jgi:DNA-binding transcriptional LysR family regulator
MFSTLPVIHGRIRGGADADAWTLVHGERVACASIRVAFRSNALHAVRELTVQGAGVAILPEWFVADEVARRALRIVLPEWRSPPVTVVALHRTAQRGEARIRALIDHLRG